MAGYARNVITLGEIDGSSRCWRADEKIRYPRVLSVVNQLNDCLSRRVTVREVAHLAGLSSPQFSHLFALAMGMTPREYMRGVRMCAGRLLLERTSLIVCEVATCTQFKNESAFTRGFKRFFGVSPKQVRKAGPWTVPANPSGWERGRQTGASRGNPVNNGLAETPLPSTCASIPGSLKWLETVQRRAYFDGS